MATPDDAITLREATEDDLPTLLALLAALDADGRQLPLARAREVFARMRAYPDYVVWLACDGDEVVGTYALLIMDNLGHRAAPEGVVENVVVREDRRGAGIGERIMRHAMARCRSRGCYKLVLSSNDARVDAHRFYDRLGFARHGVSFRCDLAVSPDPHRPDAQCSPDLRRPATAT